MRKKIGIISMNALGDTYLSLSALPVVKNKYPHAFITLFTFSGAAELGALSEVDSVIILNKSFTACLRLLLTHKEHYDELYNFFPGRINSLLLKFIKATAKYGYSNFRNIPQWYLLPQKTISGRHQWVPGQEYLKRIEYCLQEAGYVIEGRMRKYRFMPLNGDGLQERTGVLLHFSSRSSERIIPSFLVNALIEHYSGKEEVRYFMYEKLPDDISPKAKAIAPPLSESLTALGSVRLFISNDSFPLHIAEAYSVPTIALFGPTESASVISDSRYIQPVLSENGKWQIEDILSAEQRLKFGKKG